MNNHLPDGEQCHQGRKVSLDETMLAHVEQYDQMNNNVTTPR